MAGAAAEKRLAFSQTIVTIFGSSRICVFSRKPITSRITIRRKTHLPNRARNRLAWDTEVGAC